MVKRIFTKRIGRRIHDTAGASSIEYCAIAACLMLGLLTVLSESQSMLGGSFVLATVGVSRGQADTGEIESYYRLPGGWTEGTRLLFPQDQHGGGDGGGDDCRPHCENEGHGEGDY